MISPEAHSEPVKMKCFAKIVNDLTIFAKHSILDVERALNTLLIQVPLKIISKSWHIKNGIAKTQKIQIMKTGLCNNIKMTLSHRRCSVKTLALKSFAKFIGKHLCFGDSNTGVFL